MTSSGIYAIECVPTGERYVGSAVNVDRRWDRHRRELKKREHHSWKLQRAWDTHGAESFIFRILETVPEKTALLGAEQRYLDESIQSNNSLNVLPTAGSPLGSVQTPETKAKRSKTLKGHCVSEETKQKIGLKARGRKVSELTRERMRKTWAAKRAAGNVVSEATRQKRRVPVERICPQSLEIVRYSSIQAVRADGFLPSCVSNVLAGNHMTHKGYKWRYATLEGRAALSMRKKPKTTTGRSHGGNVQTSLYVARVPS